MWLTRLAFWYLPNLRFTRCLGGCGPRLDPSRGRCRHAADRDAPLKAVLVNLLNVGAQGSATRDVLAPSAVQFHRAGEAAAPASVLTS